MSAAAAFERRQARSLREASLCIWLRPRRLHGRALGWRSWLSLEGDVHTIERLHLGFSPPSRDIARALHVDACLRPNFAAICPEGLWHCFESHRHECSMMRQQFLVCKRYRLHAVLCSRTGGAAEWCLRNYVETWSRARREKRTEHFFAAAHWLGTSFSRLTLDASMPGQR